MVTTIGLVGHVAGLIGQHHWNTHGAIAYAKVSQNFILELPRPNLAKHRTLGIKPLEPLILNVESLISINTIRLQRVGSASRLGTGPVVRDLIV